MTLDLTNIKQKEPAIKKYNSLLEQIATTHVYYDYSKSVYTGIDNPIVITCPEHGDFLQTPYAHFSRGSICPKCAATNRANLKRKSKENFIDEAIKVHNNKYDYSKVNYKNTNTKVNIVCPEHGIFEQQPADHLRGHGCSKCSSKDINVLTKEEFVIRANKVHKSKYDYTKSIYVRNKYKLIITCPYHGDFTQTASDHLNGNGCQVCGENRKRAKYFSEPTILYYLYFPAFNAYKIGITLESRGIKKRFNTEKNLEYRVLKETLYSIGKEAYLEEQRILKENAHHLYKGPKFFSKGGESECFNIDVLGLNKVEDIVWSMT